MKNKICKLIVLFVSISAYSQTGIGTKTPTVSLEIKGEPSNSSVLDGLLIPKITGNELKLKNYTPEQDGALIYVTEAADEANRTEQTINVNSLGLYIFLKETNN